MLILSFRFLSGRYQAMPWGHLVSEGVVEWPPSPWRILRALVTAFHRGPVAGATSEQLDALVDKLAVELPVYRLPSATAAQPRSFPPLHDRKSAEIEGTSLQVEQGALLQICWRSLELLGPELQLLSMLLGRLCQLGGSDARVEADLVTEMPGEPNIIPADEALAATGPHDLVRLLAPADLSARQPGLPIGHLSSALSAESGSPSQKSRSRPPGSRWVTYSRPRGLLAVTTALERSSATEKLPTVARYALVSSVLPELTDALSLAETVRTALLDYAQEPIFTGRDEAGNRLPGHQQAFILPEANNPAQATITHVTVFASPGIDAPARRALDRLVAVWGRDGHHIQLVLLGLGQPEDFAGSQAEDGQCPLFGPARRWVSSTPFVATRHPEVTSSGLPRLDSDGLQIGSPEHDLRRLLQEHGAGAALLGVERTEGRLLGGKMVRWLAFHTVRKSGEERRGAGTGCGFRLTFAEPVAGPLAVGFGAHLGLGQLVPALTAQDSG